MKLTSNKLKRAIPIIMVLVTCALLLLPIIHLHPNENVYFNFLIGGLPGAAEKKVPSWGNSFGNAYYQAVLWLNKNAPQDSKLGLVQATIVNIPKTTLREDIRYSNGVWSGSEMHGEYLLDLTHQGYEEAYPFVWDYINTVLVPVYEVKVDGVVIAKVWKNDSKHAKPAYQSKKNVAVKSIKIEQNKLIIELPEQQNLAKLTLHFNNNPTCSQFTEGEMATSLNGDHYFVEPEKISDQQVVFYSSLENNLIQYIFAARPAKFISITSDSQNSCLFNYDKVNVEVFSYR